MMRVALAAAFAAAVCTADPALVSAADAPGSKTSVAVHTATAFALHGQPKYPANFLHFDYVNPNAPKSGVVHLQQPGTYDTFNPYIVRGTPHVGFTQLFTYDALMTPSGDEPATQYGLVAESLTWPDDYSWVEFNLNPNAKWHDGTPITADDVVFSVNTLQAPYTSPSIKGNFTEIAKAETLGRHKVRFTFKESGNKALIINASRLPILPKHYWQGKDFTVPTIVPPLTSGPYKIGAFDLGRSITYERVKDYWAKDLPVMRGRYNFDKLVYDFFRDQTVALEAFKAGQTDIRWETNAQEWVKGYNWPAVGQGLVKKTHIKTDGGVLFSAFFLNLRKPMFQDIRVREALNYAFDFNWANKNIYYGMMRRQVSYFGPNERAAAGHGLPSPAERKLLEPLRNEVPPRVFTQPVALPDTDGTQESLRNNLRVAAGLLQQAGYVMKNGKLVNSKTGQPFSFEILAAAGVPPTLTNAWIANLKLLGIDAGLRLVDAVQFQTRLKTFAFDVQSFWIVQVGTPGSEQRARWGSETADQPGSFNYMGIKNHAVDVLIDAVTKADSQEDYLAALHALDRVLMWNFYCVPQFHGGNVINIGYWDRFGRPAVEPAFNQAFTSVWWVDPAKDARVAAAHGGVTMPTTAFTGTPGASPKAQ
ncbi:MAG TPA: extracellular solute-binding protein [Alphaproteobacteria bacterium]|nr:extracellular solute-binding protein [Alphaproteobacteria bacterium]